MNRRNTSNTDESKYMSDVPSLAEAARAAEQCARAVIEDVLNIPFIDPADYRLDQFPMWGKFVASIDALRAALDAHNARVKRQWDMLGDPLKGIGVEIPATFDNLPLNGPSVAGGAAPLSENVQAILEMSDEDVLAQARADGLDPISEVARARGLFEEVVKRKEMADAKARAVLRRPDSAPGDSRKMDSVGLSEADARRLAEIKNAYESWSASREELDVPFLLRLIDSITTRDALRAALGTK